MNDEFSNKGHKIFHGLKNYFSTLVTKAEQKMNNEFSNKGHKIFHGLKN